jgi:hypothetical protein
MNATECASSSLEKLPSSVLAARLDELMTRERHCLSELLLHLAAFDRRRGYLEFGYQSLFLYCTDCLRMSKGTAYRRTTSARLIARFPAIVDYLRDGRLCTTSLCDLRELLNDENHRELLERASGLKEEEIKLLAATLNPKADVAESVRRVPVRSVPVIRPPIVQASRTSMAGEQATGSSLEPEVQSGTAAGEESMAGRAELTWMTLPPKPSELVPLSAERYSVRMTVSKDFVDEFRQVKNALSHVVPAGKMEDVLRECMRIAREVCEQRTRGSKPPRPIRCPSRPVGEDRPGDAPANGVSSSLEPIRASEVPSTTADSKAVPAKPVGPPPPLTQVDSTGTILEPRRKSTKSMREEPGSRYLPVAVRRRVFERDEGCCTFIGANGKRCRSTYQLQFHHKVPFARGGPATCANVTLHCARHNRHQAYEDYGASHMDRFVAAAASPST